MDCTEISAPVMFRIEERDGLRLITPLGSAAVANAPWTAENQWNRSRIETLDGETVSQGFGKFFNLGCGPAGLAVHASDIAAACERGDALATLKVDGSLLIRSVYEGRVILRTRGAWSHEHLGNGHEVAAFCRRHPLLENTGFCPDVSLLFEWVSPKNVIVLRYAEAGLTLIGAVAHGRLRYLPLASLTKTAQQISVPLVESFRLTSQGWLDLLARLTTDHSIEGYVIRLDGEQRLVKVKAEAYLTKHAMKSQLSTERLARLWFQYGQPDFAEFSKRFAADFDEELCVWAMPAISALFDGVRQYHGLMEALKGMVKNCKGWSRKDAAIEFTQAYGGTKKFGVAMSLWLGQEPKVDTLLHLLLQHTKQVEMRMFAGDDDQ